MNCQRVRDAFPALLDERTAADPSTESGERALLSEARSHLASCLDCQRDFAALTQTVRALDAMPTPQPSPRMRQTFYSMLEEEKHSAASVRVAAIRELAQRRTTLWRWIVMPLAGCALLAVGFISGQRSIIPPSTPAVLPANSVASSDNATKQELIALRQQLDKMTTLVGYSILQQQQNPANERLRDVLAAARSENVSDKTLDDLIQALTLDPSANIRLRAIEALYPHLERATVRAGVLAALPRERNPLVQLELIDFVAAAQDRNAAPLLETISSDGAADRTVRDAAKLALAQF